MLVDVTWKRIQTPSMHTYSLDISGRFAQSGRRPKQAPDLSGWATDEFPAAELQKQKFDLVNYVQLHGYASQLRVVKR
jgi:hypothetical protein